MIFGRNRKRGQRDDEASEPDDATEPDGAEADGAGVDGAGADGAGADGAVSTSSGDSEPEGLETKDEATDEDAAEPPANEAEVDVAALDAQEWRTDGPYDVSELHDEEPDDDHPRIDLGALVLTGVPGSELRLQVSEETQEIISAMLILGVPGPEGNGSGQQSAATSSAIELAAYAAPRSGGLWAELREDIAQAAVDAGGTSALAEGPFGVELRRFVPVTTPDGEQGYQPSRMWVAEGPRWLLRGIVYGQAAIEDDLGSAAVSGVVDAFRTVVVRRGDEAMAPGDLLPMTMPSDAVPAP